MGDTIVKISLVLVIFMAPFDIFLHPENFAKDVVLIVGAIFFLKLVGDTASDIDGGR